MALGYDPKTSKAIPNYVVKTAGDLAQCKKLSPLGVETVAT